MIVSLFSFMPMFVCLFWTVVISIELFRRKDAPLVVLWVFMMTATILYFGHSVFFNRQTNLVPLTDVFYVGANLAVYPLYLIYILELTQHRQRRFMRLFWLLPSIVVMLAVGTLYLEMDYREIDLFVDTYLYGNSMEGLTGSAWMQAIAHNICKAVFGIIIIPVFIIGSRSIRRYDYQVMAHYADTDDKTLYHLTMMMAFFVITSALSFAFNIVGRQFFLYDSSIFLVVPSAIFSILLFAIGHMGVHQKFGMQQLESELEMSEKLSLAVSPNENAEELSSLEEGDLKSRVERLMTEEKLYLQHNLKLSDLIRRLNTNRNYLYNVINREMGISFSEYINRLRVEHAVAVMTESPEKLLTVVADESGFTSNSSFYRNFKTYIGQSPREFQDSIVTEHNDSVEEDTDNEKDNTK